jgi:hypothetical protein
MTTICLIGNSHVANLKRALPEVAPAFPGIGTIFFASDGMSLETEVRDGKLVARTGTARGRMAMTSGTDGDIAPVYDAYVVCGLTLSSMRAIHTFGPTLQSLRDAGRLPKSMTAEDVAAGMVPAIRGSLALGAVSGLRQITDAPIFVIATPFTAYERHEAMWAGFERWGRVSLLAEGYALACKRAAESHGAVFVEQPPETIGPNALTTLPAFYTLSPEETRVERAHHAHMNAVFGAIVLRDVLTRIAVALHLTQTAPG